jgi:DNA-binding NarL/FixJ family response regulator
VGVSTTSGPDGRRTVADVRQRGRVAKIALVALDDVSRRRIAGILVRTGFEASAAADDACETFVIVQAASTGDAVREVRRDHPTATVVVIVPDADAKAVRAALDAGADAVVPESRAEHALAPAIEAAFAGLVAVPGETRGHTLRPALSSREKQVLGMVVLGFSNGEIAGKLHLAETTVKSHLSSVFRKLGVRSRSEAAALVLDANSGLGLGVLSISDGTSE